MNKLSNWISNKEFLPLPDRLLLLKIDKYEYTFARLDSVEQLENGDYKVYFLPELDGESGYELNDIIAWAYANLDDTDDL